MKKEILELLERTRKNLNEVASIGPKFNGNYKVLVVLADKSAHYIKDNLTLLKFIPPKRLPKSIKDIKPCIAYKAKECTDEELEILINWMSEPYYFKSGIIAINYAMLVDRFYGQQEGFKDDAKYLIKYLKKFMKK